jgi:hypothetical protein
VDEAFPRARQNAVAPDPRFRAPWTTTKQRPLSSSGSVKKTGTVRPFATGRATTAERAGSGSPGELENATGTDSQQAD